MTRTDVVVVSGEPLPDIERLFGPELRSRVDHDPESWDFEGWEIAEGRRIALSYVWSGSFKDLDVSAFRVMMSRLQLRWPSRLIVLMRDEEEDSFRLWHYDTGGELTPIPHEFE